MNLVLLNSRKCCLYRYYANPAAGIHAGSEENLGLQAGQLADETREALGLGPLDPPPWLDKMRQLGYPPMYKYACCVLSDVVACGAALLLCSSCTCCMDIAWFARPSSSAVCVAGLP